MLGRFVQLGLALAVVVSVYKSNIDIFSTDNGSGGATPSDTPLLVAWPVQMAHRSDPMVCRDPDLTPSGLQTSLWRAGHLHVRQQHKPPQLRQCNSVTVRPHSGRAGQATTRILTTKEKCARMSTPRN